MTTMEPKPQARSGECRTHEVGAAPLSICTIVSKNYLAHARCLVDSFLDHHPQGRAFVLLVDRPEGYFDPGKERFTTVPVEELQIADFRVLSFRYTLLELCTAVKPFFLEFLFRSFGLEKLCYFDPDILICGSLDEVAAGLETSGILLTPHILDFLEDGYYPDELDILQAGTFNLGFIGLSRHAGLERFLSWWQRKLLLHCTAEEGSGLFVDQRWIDLVPSLFEGVHILRDPSYNVAYWNLAHRTVTREGGTRMINGVPLKFFHFSGFVPEDIRQVSKHQNRVTLGDVPGLGPLFVEYRDTLLARGYDTVKAWPNAFGSFDNGVAIPDSARRAYRGVDPEGTRWRNPFSTTGPASFFEWLNQPALAGPGGLPLITHLALQIYRERPDLQRAFPDVLDRDRGAYAAWFASNGRREHALDPCFAAAPHGTWRGDASATGRGEKVGGSGGSLVRGLWTGSARSVSRLKRGLVLLAFHLNNATRVGPAFKRLVGRGASRRLKHRLLRMGGLPVGTAGVPPLELEPSGARGRSRTFTVGLAHGLNVVGYLRSENGVGEIARGTLRALGAVGFPVGRTNVDLGDRARQHDTSCDEVPAGNPYATNLLHINADQVPAVAAHLGQGFLTGRRNIGFWFWETDSFPGHWRDRFSYFDEIWVASSFTQTALAAVSPVPVVRMRPCVEVGLRERVGRGTFGLPENRFVFLFAFDPFSISERKNPFGVVEAYRRAFGSRSEEALLVLKVNQLDRVGGFEETLGIGEGYASRLGDAVRSVSGVLLDRYLDRGEFLSLLGASDAFVSLHRSEGFGLVIAEAMLLGKPCIATGYSSNTEFMTPTNSYLVDYRLVELDRDFGPYQRGSTWADPDLDHAAGLMRRVVTNREEAAARGARAAVELAGIYGRGPVGEAMVRRLEFLSEGKAS
jgi:glycosyltransferase involved in cell wall biosynthesis